MLLSIPAESIEEIRNRADIVALVGEYVRLKKTGVRFTGLCPFHDEKTPSFSVMPDRRFYYCFGCQASGDVFSFLMRFEGKSFAEAARALAERTGVALPVVNAAEEAAYQRKKSQEERYVSLVDAAAGFYVAQLASHQHGAMARAEYERRGLQEEVVQTFRLGYAPAEWDALATYLAARKLSLHDAETLGLVGRRGSSNGNGNGNGGHSNSGGAGSGYYDRFRHRLMFPISDVHGRIVAFSGRALPEVSEMPAREGKQVAKYINSPEGPLYTKGKILFGLHEGRVAVRREAWALVCEGNFDVLALHQAGFANAVAPMGTALTADHAKVLRRYTEKVALLFDGDAAGRKATGTAGPMLHQAGLHVQVVTLPPGEDPDSFLQTQGAEALRQRVDAAPGILPYLIDDAAANAGMDPRAKALAIAALGPTLAMVNNAIESQFYIERIAQKFGIQDLRAVQRQLRRGLKQHARRQPTRSRQRPPSSENLADPETKLSANTPANTLSQASHQPSRVHFPPLELEILGALIDEPALLLGTYAESFDNLLTIRDLRGIFMSVKQMFASRGRLDAPALLVELSGNQGFEWFKERLALRRYQGAEAEQLLRDGVPRLARQSIERALPTLRATIVEAQRVGDDALASRLRQEYITLTRKAHQLTQK